MALIDYLSDIVDSKLKYNQSGQEVHFDCPLCHETRSRMYVNLDTHKYHCFNCNASGTFVDFITKVEGLSYGKAVERYNDLKGNLYTPEDVSLEIQRMLIGDLYADIEQRPIPLPSEYIPLNFNSKNPVMKKAIRYLMINRKVSIEQMKTHQMGICMSGEYANRIIIPIIIQGSHRFFVARSFDSKSRLKEKSPANESYQISKSQVVFNIDRASMIFNSCVITEGIFDALSFGDVGVSLLGKRMSDDQLSILLQYRNQLTNGIYIALDWDARNDAINLADILSQYFTVYMIDLPKGDLPKGYDPNDYFKHFGRKAMLELIQEAEEYGLSYKVSRKLLM